MTTTKMVRRVKSREEVQRVVCEYEASGLSQREFAERIGIKVTTLQYWLYRRAKSRPSPFVEVEPAPGPSPGQAHYRLEFPGGKALTISGAVHPRDLEQLCRLLRA